MNHILPQNPGRERRLAYGDIVNKRNIRRVEVEIERRFDEIFHGHETFNDTNNNLIVIGNRLENRRIRVESGLLLKDLYKNSTVHFKKEKLLCSICLNEKTDNITRKLICNHYFHINCIEMWLSDNNNCPICRHNLKVN